MSRGLNRAKQLEHTMKIVERTLGRRVQTLIKLNKMQFGFMPGKRIVDAVFVVKRMQEEYQKKKKGVRVF